MTAPTPPTNAHATQSAEVEAHWNEHIVVDQWGNSVFKRDTPGCRFCDALSGRAARRRDETTTPPGAASLTIPANLQAIADDGYDAARAYANARVAEIHTHLEAMTGGTVWPSLSVVREVEGEPRCLGCSAVRICSRPYSSCPEVEGQ